MRGCGGQIRGFTLVEMVVVIAIMALLTSAAALSFSGPLRATRASDAIRQVQSFDDATRQHAKRFGKDLQIVLDLSRDRLIRRQSADGPAMHELQLPHGCRIERVRVGGKVIDSGEAVLACSNLGLTRSYAAHLVGPGLDRWILVAGLTGEVTTATHDLNDAGSFDAEGEREATRDDAH
jgi:prepilin-type N-terminal cleavage/methylation domain-containing protein